MGSLAGECRESNKVKLRRVLLCGRRCLNHTFQQEVLVMTPCIATNIYTKFR